MRRQKKRGTDVRGFLFLAAAGIFCALCFTTAGKEFLGGIVVASSQILL